LTSVKVIGAEREVFLVVEIAQAARDKDRQSETFPFAHFAPEALLAALKIAGTQRRPRRQVSRQTESDHAQSDL
jgi:hypothetical protein